MSGNSFSRGLIAKFGENIIYTDRSNYQGLFMIGEDGEPVQIADGICWFMNALDGHVFCSNESDGNRLYRFMPGQAEHEVILREPCYGVQLCEPWIYYIHEGERRLCRIRPDGSGNEVLVKKGVDSFLIVASELWYSTESGILKCNCAGGGDTMELDISSPWLAKIDDYLFLSDRTRGYQLCRWDTQTGSIHRFEGISALDVCADANYLYCANLNDNKSVYRIGAGDSFGIRISSESAFGLQLIDSELYFFNLNDRSRPYRMPSDGGRTVPMTTQTGE